MAIEKTQYQITWPDSALTDKSIPSADSVNSDERAIADEAVRGDLTIKADNDGTPVSGDVIEVRVLFTNGDPDADPDSSDEFDTGSSALVVRELDTNDEDPAIISIPIRVSAKAFKVRVTNSASSNAITVSAQYNEQTA